MIRLALHQAGYDLRMFTRNRQARLFTLFLPVTFLVIFLGVFGNRLIGAEHVKTSSYYVPGIASLAVLNASFSNLVIAIVTQRELGILKRRRATPAPAGVMIAGRALTSVVVSLAVAAVVIAIGRVAFGVDVAISALGAIAVTVAIGSLALACVGYAFATAVGAAEAAQPATLAVTLPLAFISGIYIPSPNLPHALQQIGEGFPLEHLVAALRHSFVSGGAGIAWGDLAVLAAWGLAGIAVAVPRFRWTPAALRS